SKLDHYKINPIAQTMNKANPLALTLRFEEDTPLSVFVVKRVASEEPTDTNQVPPRFNGLRISCREAARLRAISAVSFIRC
ncbi:MAG: hypothetical protein QME81_13630, partial [bacterium]|nr:hypothetical protein [bacterium]